VGCLRHIQKCSNRRRRRGECRSVVAGGNRCRYRRCPDLGRQGVRDRSVPMPRGPTVPSSLQPRLGAALTSASTARSGRSIVQVRGSQRDGQCHGHRVPGHAPPLARASRVTVAHSRSLRAHGPVRSIIQAPSAAIFSPPPRRATCTLRPRLGRRAPANSRFGSTSHAAPPPKAAPPDPPVSWHRDRTAHLARKCPQWRSRRSLCARAGAPCSRSISESGDVRNLVPPVAHYRPRARLVPRDLGLPTPPPPHARSRARPSHALAAVPPAAPSPLDPPTWSCFSRVRSRLQSPVPGPGPIAGSGSPFGGLPTPPAPARFARALAESGSGRRIRPPAPPPSNWPLNQLRTYERWY
jgi:hypothetical protein